MCIVSSFRLQPFLSSGNLRAGISLCRSVGRRLKMQSPKSNAGTSKEATAPVQKATTAAPKGPTASTQRGTTVSAQKGPTAPGKKGPTASAHLGTTTPAQKVATTATKKAATATTKKTATAPAKKGTPTTKKAASAPTKKAATVTTKKAATTTTKTAGTAATQKAATSPSKKDKTDPKTTGASSRPSSDLAAFREEFAKAKHIVILTGAGVSAESGVPTFRGAGGFWRKWQAKDLASPEAFEDNPSLVWEFYHYRREVMGTKRPNPAHKAIAEMEKRLTPQGRKVVVITQNIDELHKAAGSEDILELHGSLFRVRCTKCAEVTVNKDSPICPALAGKGEPNPKAPDAKIPVDKLPKCKKDGCGGLLRPDVVWFGESLNREVLARAFQEIGDCDLCLVIGTSSVVYPAAMFAPQVAERGVTVAEFNIESTPATDQFGYMFEGPAGVWLPKALAPHPSEQK